MSCNMATMNTFHKAPGGFSEVSCCKSVHLLSNPWGQNPLELWDLSCQPRQKPVKSRPQSHGQSWFSPHPFLLSSVVWKWCMWAHGAPRYSGLYSFYGWAWCQEGITPKRTEVPVCPGDGPWLSEGVSLQGQALKTGGRVFKFWTPLNLGMSGDVGKSSVGPQLGTLLNLWSLTFCFYSLVFYFYHSHHILKRPSADVWQFRNLPRPSLPQPQYFLRCSHPDRPSTWLGNHCKRNLAMLPPPNCSHPFPSLISTLLIEEAYVGPMWRRLLCPASQKQQQAPLEEPVGMTTEPQGHSQNGQFSCKWSLRF
jgi:hypothetical protein